MTIVSLGIYALTAWGLIRLLGLVWPSAAAPDATTGLPTLGEVATSSDQSSAIIAPPQKPRYHAYDTLCELLDELRSRGVDEKQIDALGAQIAPLLLKRKTVSP